MKRIVTILLLAACHGQGQTRINLRTQTKDADFSAAAATKPAKTGTVLPASCSVGEVFFKSDAPGGRNLYSCGAANVWTQLGGVVKSGCGLAGCENGECSVDSGIVPSYGGTLDNGNVLLGGGTSMIRALAAGAAGQVLLSQGAGRDPSWGDPAALTNHAGLSGLDYAVSGHTGFQPALGYAPEQELSFATPLLRTGNMITCPGCASGSGGTAMAFGVDFALQTSVTVAGVAHGFASADVQVAVFDEAMPRNRVEPDRVSVDPASRNVTVVFAVPQSGRLIVTQ